ncbi:MAG: HEPN domain-containing protein [Candidatus Curtissbacteria bacterium]|nr:HEPN domain-containing protein [Candidatus Curtissbacteria bacterium]
MVFDIKNNARRKKSVKIIEAALKRGIDLSSLSEDVVITEVKEGGVGDDYHITITYSSDQLNKKKTMPVPSTSMPLAADQNAANPASYPSKKMGTYFFRFITPTRLTFSDWLVHQKWEQNGIKVNLPSVNAEMMVFDKRIKHKGTFMHYGLGCDIKIMSQNEKEAKLRSEVIVLEFLTLISYLEKCYFGAPSMILEYEYPEEGTSIKNYSAIIFDNNYIPKEISPRPINIQRLQIFLNKFEPLEPNKKMSISQTLHWFWKALGAADKRDRFLSLWIALEFLEEELKKRYGLAASKSTLPKCPHCKNNIDACPKCKKPDPFYKTNTGFTGYKEIEKAIKGKTLKFDQIHAYRSKLIHGNNITVREVDDSIMSTVILINLAILTLMDMSTDPDVNASDAIEMAKGSIRKLALPIMYRFDGEIKVSEIPEIDHTEKQPFVSGDFDLHFKIINGFKIETDGKLRHQFHGVFQSGKVKKILMVDESEIVEKVWEII